MARVQDAGPSVRPDWVDNLREEVSVVPKIDVREGPAPSQDERSSLGARGLPEDLTQRLKVATPAGATPRSSASRPASGRSGGRGGGGGGSSGAVANVNVNVAAPLAAVPIPASAPIPQPISATELRYRGDYEQSPSRMLLQFGYEYFFSQQEDADSTPAASEMLPDEPIATAVPLDPNYRVRVGDALIVSVTGTLELNERVSIGRDGTVVLPEVGSLAVAGLSLEEVRRTILSAYEKERVGLVVQVSLAKLELGRIHVVGDVHRPGPHLVTMPADLIDVLAIADGPTKSGSLRRVRIDRSNGDEETVDLYELLMGGNRLDVAPLSDGDIVSVPPIGTTVGIAGSVQRPAIYETAGPMTIGQMIELAGGITPFTFQSNIQVERTTGGRGREILDLSMDPVGMGFELQSGDLILLGAIDKTMRPLVRIEGQVVRPGDFQFQDGMRLADLVRLADGLLIDASLDQALVSRQVGPTGEVEILTGTRRQRSSRRLLVADIEKALLGDPDHNIQLQPLDHITIQPRSATSVLPTVEVIGAVQRPGTFELTSDLHVSDLVALGGNLIPSAYMEEAELVRNVYDEDSRQMSVRRMRIDLAEALEQIPGADPRLVHGDRLVIRRLKESFVTVEVDGEVRFPGTYVFPSTAKITDLLAAAGGLLPQADIRASRFTRASVRELQGRRFRQLAEFIREQAEASYTRMVQVGSPQEGVAGRIALDHTRELIGRMASYQPDGRIVIPWVTDEFPTSIFNLSLEDGDTLLVAKQHQTVSVVGHVFNSGAFVAYPGLSAQELIEKCGGVTDQGDLKRMYVIRADGNVQLVKGNRSSSKIAVYAGDILMVPRQKLQRTMMAQVTDALHLLRSGAETGLLLNNLEQVNLGLNWVSGSTSRAEYRVSDGLYD